MGGIRSWFLWKNYFPPWRLQLPASTMWDFHLQKPFTIQRFWLIVTDLLSRQPGDIRSRRWKPVPQIADTITPTAIPSTELLPDVDSLCTSCHFAESKFPSTTVSRSSDAINKNVALLKKGAAEGCWLCQALLAATQLWRDYDTKIFDKMIQFDARYDFERFLIRGQACFPSVQIYCPEGRQTTYVMIQSRIPAPVRC